MRDLSINEITKELKDGALVSFIKNNKEIEDAKIRIVEDNDMLFVYLCQNYFPSSIVIENNEFKYAYCIGWADSLRLNQCGVKITSIGELNKKREIVQGMKLQMANKDFVVNQVHLNIVFLAYPEEPDEVVRKHDKKKVLEEAKFID